MDSTTSNFSHNQPGAESSNNLPLQSESWAFYQIISLFAVLAWIIFGFRRLMRKFRTPKFKVQALNASYDFDQGWNGSSQNFATNDAHKFINPLDYPPYPSSSRPQRWNRSVGLFQPVYNMWSNFMVWCKQKVYQKNSKNFDTMPLTTFKNPNFLGSWPHEQGLEKSTFMIGDWPKLEEDKDARIIEIEKNLAELMDKRKKEKESESNLSVPNEHLHERIPTTFTPSFRETLECVA